jgi:hypothetical protein
MRAGYLVTRIVLVWLLTAGALFLISAILPGFHVNNWGSALVTAAFIGLANAFLLFPRAWEAPEEELVCAEAVHRRLRHWLAALGHEAYQ